MFKKFWLSAYLILLFYMVFVLVNDISSGRQLTQIISLSLVTLVYASPILTVAWTSIFEILKD